MHPFFFQPRLSRPFLLGIRIALLQKDVEYIQEMEVLDLVKEEWVGKESMADNREQRGSYRTTCCADEAGNVVLYSNFNVSRSLLCSWV